MRFIFDISSEQEATGRRALTLGRDAFFSGKFDERVRKRA